MIILNGHDPDQRRCDKAYMSRDIPSRARYNCIFGGGDQIWSTNQGAGMHVHRCGRSPAARLSMARFGVYFAPKYLRPFYDLTTDEEVNDCVCVLAKARLEIHVGSGPD